MDAVQVAIDVGPLAGRRTGIGVAVDALVTALRRRDDVVLRPYLTSFRARPEAGTARLPIPAALAHRSWARASWPRADRHLGGAEVVHGTNYVVPPSRLPRLVSVYDCWFLDHPEQAQPDVARAGRVLLRSLAEGAHVHACSQATANAVRRHAPGAQVHVVPLGPISLGEPSPSCPVPGLDGHPYVLAVGTLERRKNLPRLVEAFGRLGSDHPDVRLVIAGGDGDDRWAVDRAVLQVSAVHGADVASRIVLAGYVDDASRSWLLRHARVLAYPSLDEGFGFPLLDAMQAGVPIVATDVGSIPEVAGAAALLARPDDVAGLVSNLAAAMTDGPIRRALQAAAPAQLASFSWERTADALCHVYRTLAARSGSLRPEGTP